MPYVQSNSAQATGTVTVTLNSVGAGNTLVVYAFGALAPLNSSTPTDNFSDTFHIVGGSGTVFDPGEPWYAYNVHGGNTTISWAVPNHGPCCCTASIGELLVYELTRPSGGGDPFDQVATKKTLASAASPVASNSITTTHANDSLIGYMQTTGASAITAGAGYGHLITVSDSGSIASSEIQDVTSTGTYTASFTFTGSATGAMRVMAFKSDPAVAANTGSFFYPGFFE